jgi:hypothetical protein
MKRTLLMLALLIGMVFGVLTAPPYEARHAVLTWAGFAVTTIGILAGVLFGKQPPS